MLPLRCVKNRWWCFILSSKNDTLKTVIDDLALLYIGLCIGSDL